jgi:hypothetical protein
MVCIISTCDEKFRGKSPLKIDELNLFVVFPKKQVGSAIRNHRLFDACKKAKYSDTEMSHEKERIIVAKRVGTYLSLFKATGTISIENIESFFSNKR